MCCKRHIVCRTLCVYLFLEKEVYIPPSMYHLYRVGTEHVRLIFSQTFLCAIIEHMDNSLVEQIQVIKSNYRKENNGHVFGRSFKFSFVAENQISCPTQSLHCSQI